MQQTYSYNNNVLIISGSGTLEKFSGYNDATKIIVNEGFTAIAVSVFRDREKLLELELPDSIQKIENHLLIGTHIKELRIPRDLTDIADSQPFDQCDYFERFIVDENHPKYCEKDGILYSKDMKTLYSYPGGKQDIVYEIPYGVEILWYSCVGQNPYLKYIIVPSTATTSYTYFGYKSSAVKVIIFRCENQDEIEWVENDPFYQATTMTKEKIDWLYTPYVFNLSSDATTLSIKRQSTACVNSNTFKGFGKVLNDIVELKTVLVDTHIQALFDYSLFDGCYNLEKISFLLKCFTKRKTILPTYNTIYFICILKE